ncbi:carboxypeptidase-like regulatory domain-containing protein [Mucilaginibacter sp.]|jgi:hypothetical protein|uniref:carboxypeptidase-like regulatory domain-containing protein n=1 Tax=Mucilaginibacter sp. TaxID=1882438 RepID=UPI003564BEE8
MKHLSLLLLLLPFACFAQLRIEGRVVNATDGKSIPDASVYLTNTTIGQKSNADGTFSLNILRAGQYDLIVTAIGYEGYRETVMVNESVKLPDIKILPKTTMMKDVRIVGKDPKRARKLRIFKEQFLGSSAIANQCKILNPEILDLRFTKGEKQLLAKTNDFLEIENVALGYKLKYLVSEFVLDEEAGTVVYEGAVLFEEKDGTPSEKSRREKNRLEVYFGSSTHFLRQVLANQADVNYLVRNFCIKGIDPHLSNTFKYDTLHPKDYIHPTDKRGIYAMSYNDQVDIYHYLSNHTRRMGAGLVVTITFLEPDMFFDSNGIILNRKSVLFRNAWGKSRVAELLPIDFWPETEEKSLPGDVEKNNDVPYQRIRPALGGLR